MDFKEMCRMLPEYAPYEVEDYVDECRVSSAESSFPLCVFHRESVEIVPKFDDMGFMNSSHKERWGARCRCSLCDETFTAGWSSGDVKGIYLFQGEDGEFYPGYCNEDEHDAIKITDGEAFTCPCCGSYVELTHARSIRHGRVNRTQVTEVTNVGKYTAVISWIAVQFFNKDGDEFDHCFPREAIVIDESGKLERFSHVVKGMYGERISDKWRRLTKFDDPMQSRFYSYDEGWCKGSELMTNTEGFYGKTGEKTGLMEYLQSEDGHWPNVYLRIQRKYPQIENLMKTGWADLISSAIERAVATNLRYSQPSCLDLDFPENIFDFTQAKPHRILGLTKEEYKAGAGKHYSYDNFKQYKEFCEVLPMSLSDYQQYRIEVFDSGMRKIMEMINSGMDDIRNIRHLFNYLESAKGGRTMVTALDFYRDYREFLRHVYEIIEPALLYPKNLQHAHDDMATRAAYINAGPVGDFKNIIDAYGPLEWTDGELCIRLPRCGEDLIGEGYTLRHCVGGYISSHKSGKKVVFFVRHYRRPERSYYTLDITVDDFGHPHINQLHGYGNERHGKNLEFRHTIPTKVKAFVSRWEEEILKPFFFREKMRKMEEISKTA